MNRSKSSSRPGPMPVATKKPDPAPIPIPIPKPVMRTAPFDEMPVVLFFKQRGWIVEELHANLIELVDVPDGAALGCGDGREIRAATPIIELAYKHGPKIFGATSGLAALYGYGTLEGLKKIITRIVSLHYVPGCHGDNHNGIAGCGQNALWAAGKLSKLPPLQMTSEEIKNEVLAYNGVYVDHLHYRTEATLDLNFIPKRTQVPAGMRFHEDLWFLQQVSSNNAEILQKAYLMIAETVEQLTTTVRTARIIH